MREQLAYFLLRWTDYICWSILGCFIRILFQLYTSSSLHSGYSDVIFSSALGCFVSGFILSQTNRLRTLEQTKKHVISAFCGSLTTFSSWQWLITISVFGEIGEDIHWHVFAGLADLVIVLSLSQGLYYYGLHALPDLAIEAEDREEEEELGEKTSSDLSLRIFNLLIILIAGVFAIATNLLPSYCWLSLTIAPIGAMIRYFLSNVLNGKYGLPIGLLTANTVATFLMGLSYCQRLVQHPELRRWMVLRSGFCGGLSSLSAFINDLNHLSRRQSWLYALMSIGICQFICIACRLAK